MKKLSVYTGTTKAWNLAINGGSVVKLSEDLLENATVIKEGNGNAYAEGTTFSVTVPTSLHVSVDANGEVTVATDAKIINNSFGAVKVTDLQIAATGGWALVDYDSADMTAEKVNTKKMAMTINGEKTTGADAISFTAANWDRMEGKNATDSDELAITYDAKVPAQSAAIDGSTVANVTFTVAWDLAD